MTWETYGIAWQWQPMTRNDRQAMAGEQRVSECLGLGRPDQMVQLDWSGWVDAFSGDRRSEHRRRAAAGCEGEKVDRQMPMWRCWSSHTGESRASWQSRLMMCRGGGSSRRDACRSGTVFEDIPFLYK